MLPEVLTVSPLFSLVPASAIECCTRSLARGDKLWEAGTPATWFSVVACGVIKIVKPAGAIVAMFGRGASIGDVAVVSRGTYPADAVCATASANVVRVRAEPILELAQQRADLAAALSAALVAHTHALDHKIRVMSAGPVTARLATLLLGGFPCGVSRGELASLVGARPETTTRVMRDWEKRGIVTTTDDGVIVHDRDALASAAAAASE